VLSLNDEFRANYNAHIKAQNDQRSREANAKEEGIVKGISIGEERGIVKGIAIGEEKGIAIGKKEEKKEIVFKLLKKEMSLEDIAEITGISLEEVQKYRRDN
jgi:predicted transposase/invertase (TIGR01784 family)